MIYDDYLTELPFEQRVPLIKTAIIHLDGVFPKILFKPMSKGGINYFYLNRDNKLHLYDVHHGRREDVCTKEEFYRVVEGGL